jgi:hypothetical protein
MSASMGRMRHQIHLVPKPEVVLPEHEDEIFVRLSLLGPGSEEPDLAFTMPVSDMLRLLYGMAADVREIVHNDTGDLFPPSLYNPN